MTAPSVLLLGGPSGTGKTTVAKRIARERGMAWVQVDDLRLALQWSDARLPSESATEALHFFLRTPDVWTLPAARLREALIASGGVMIAAIGIVVGNHVVQGDPAVIEGDAILPAIVEHPEVRRHVASGAVRTAFLMPGSEEELLRNMLERGRGVSAIGETPEARRAAEANWLYAQWLEREAQSRNLTLVPTRPWDTLQARLLGQ